MRSSREDMAKHRKEIIDASARLFREKGAEDVSVPELMQAVGMTHGGFYKHFGSKDDLAPARLRPRLRPDHGSAGEAAGKHDGDPRRRLECTRLRLSRRPLTATISVTAVPPLRWRAMPRASTRQSASRDAYEAGVERMLHQVLVLQDGPDARAKSLVALATLVGALLLSRSTDGELSDAFLATAREHLVKGALR